MYRRKKNPPMSEDIASSDVPGYFLCVRWGSKRGCVNAIVYVGMYLGLDADLLAYPADAVGDLLHVPRDAPEELVRDLDERDEAWRNECFDVGMRLGFFRRDVLEVGRRVRRRFQNLTVDLCASRPTAAKVSQCTCPRRRHSPPQG